MYDICALGNLAKGDPGSPLTSFLGRGGGLGWPWPGSEKAPVKVQRLFWLKPIRKD